MLSGLGNWLGYGQSGTNAGDELPSNAGYLGLNQMATNGQDPNIQGVLTSAAASGNGNSLLGANNATAQQAVLDPNTSSLLAAAQVQNNPLYSTMFGQGGLQGQLANDEQTLDNNQSWQYQPQDFTAMGQASDAIARNMGASQGSLMNSLASRGMAQGGSGASGVAFSGLQGNQNEQLANMQTQIANDRMNMNLNRLNAVRGQQLQLQGEAQSALGQQEGNNLNAVGGYENEMNNSLNAGIADQNQQNTMFNQTQSTKTPTFGQIMGAFGTENLGNMSGALSGMGGNSVHQSPGQTGYQQSGGGAGGSLASNDGSMSLGNGDYSMGPSNYGSASGMFGNGLTSSSASAAGVGG